MTRLPSGRHHLSRDEVAGAQRARMLKAAAEVMSTQGYPSATVAAIIKRAGVSRETFYQQFPNKQACFIAALEAAIEVLAGAVEPPSAGTPVERFDRFVGTYLDALAENPALARLFLIETYSAGPDAMRRRLELQQHFVDLLAKTFDARSPRDRFACQALVGSIVSLVTAHFVTNTPVAPAASVAPGAPRDFGDLGSPGDLRALRAPIVALAQDLLVR